MKRFLVLCERDWLSPKAGAVEHYVRQVFARISRAGHYVAWVSHSPSGWFSRTPPRPRIEIVDGIQVARLGARCLYRTMVRLFLARLAKSGPLAGKFDAIIDCMTGCPTLVPEDLDARVLPVVFRVNKKLRGAEQPPGPVIAATSEVATQLHRVGIPNDFIVYAPFGGEPSRGGPEIEKGAVPCLMAWEPAPRPMLAAVRRLRNDGIALHVDLLTRPGRRVEGWCSLHDLRASPTNLIPLFQRAWFGYCGVSMEWMAPAIAGWGLPVICPDTAAGREFVENGVTGLLFNPKDRAQLCEVLARLSKDEVLRKRFAARARERALEESWDKTAEIVLKTIERL